MFYLYTLNLFKGFFSFFTKTQRIHAYNSRILYYVMPSYGRPEQGHLAHCILGKSRQTEPEVRITRYALAVFIYAFCDSCQFPSIYSTLNPLIYIKRVKTDPQYLITCTTPYVKIPQIISGRELHTLYIFQSSLKTRFRPGSWNLGSVRETLFVRNA